MERKLIRAVGPKSAAAFAFLLTLLPTMLPQRLGSETLTLVTTYPSPLGIYKNIITTDQAVLARNNGNVILAPPTNVSGNVGIGTTAPSSKLGVYTTLPGQTAAYFATNDAGAIAAYGSNSASGAWAIIGGPWYGVEGDNSNPAGSGIVGYHSVSRSYGLLGLNGLGVYGVVGNPGDRAVEGDHDDPGSPSSGILGLGRWGTLGSLGVYGSSGHPEGAGVEGYNSTNGVYGFLGYKDQWTLWGNGNAYISGTYQGSDLRLKENIQPIGNSLGKILSLNPVSFNWKKDTDQYVATKGRDYGFIGQEMEKVIPEIVKDVQAAKHHEGRETLNTKLGVFKAIEYTRLIPFLADAIREFHREFSADNRRRQAENEALLKRISKLEDRLRRLESHGSTAALPGEAR